MAAIPPPRDQWYVVHVLAGQEQKVRDNLTRRIQTEEMGDYIFEVLVPTEQVQEVRRGQKRETKRKFFPGYVIANMWLLTDDGKLVDKTWYFVRETTGVINFAGARNRPMPMPEREVKSMLDQIRASEGNVKPKIEFEVGDSVKVADGPFESQTGIVEEIDPDRGKLRVSVTIFGRATPVDLEFWQVEKG